MTPEFLALESIYKSTVAQKIHFILTNNDELADYSEKFVQTLLDRKDELSNDIISFRKFVEKSADKQIKLSPNSNNGMISSEKDSKEIIQHLRNLCVEIMGRINLTDYITEFRKITDISITICFATLVLLFAKHRGLGDDMEDILKEIE